MIGQQVTLDLPYDEPVRPNHVDTFHSGQVGVVVAIHPRWDAYVVLIGEVRALFFPDEIKETKAS